MVAETADSNKQTKAEISEGKAKILRAGDIIPSSGKAEEDKLVEWAGGPAGRRENQIPKFNLAEDIMAEHRKITAIKRKPPGQINAPQSLQQQIQLTIDTTERSGVILSKAEPIIAEIVAKDIARLCAGRGLTTSRYRTSAR